MASKRLVEAYRYVSPETSYHHCICRIVARRGYDDDGSPWFKVIFGDGTETEASAEELEPWYPDTISAGEMAQLGSLT